ncbi:MAG: ATP-dependent DNA helicase RecG [Coriobacteriales bacterium]|nr:ATP-dependent DNA helicase RecG [Coriobacteriales bacterium]
MPAANQTDRADRLAAHEAPVASARFVDTKRAALLGKLGVETVGDLVRHYPFRYLDLTATTSAADAKPGTDVTVVGVVKDVRAKQPKPRLSIVEVALGDGTGTVVGVWFNQPYMKQRFAVGERVAFAGHLEFDFGLKQIKNPFIEKLDTHDAPERLGRILPIHRTTEGLTTTWLRTLVTAAVEDYADVPDHIPSALRASRGLISLRSALRDIHLPEHIDDAEGARRRLAYDEFLLMQLFMRMRRHALTREQAGVAARLDGPALAALKRAVPFELTADQLTAVEEVLADMSSPRPMNRMLLGDVGTGKTLVAAHALAASADTGMQAAMMAPTEVLATQYACALGPLLDRAGVRWALLTGSTGAADRRRILEGTADGTLQVLFGTHALLESKVRFARLALAIVDEQHRFGVRQRLGLRGKGATSDLLVMTATPIPRSLALTLYGDLDTSYLRERPGERGSDHVATELVRPARRDKAYEAVRAAVREGRQAFVVCPLVDESDALEVKAATRHAEILQRQVFPDLRVGLLTGRMKPTEKAEAMQAFRDRRTDVLVATTVIEVGVDVPNATVMVVEDADRFGLAQLHQLRGRVGRGEHPGRVVLVADPKSADSRERLSALAETSDGFELAERDLRIRGEGHILGDRQHGLPELKLASVLTDSDLLLAAREDAERIIERDPHLKLPQHGPLLAEVYHRYRRAWTWVKAG